MSSVDELKSLLKQKEEEFLEFQEDSKEYEAELEKTVDRCERQLQESTQQKQKLENELRYYKEKLILTTSELNSQVNSLQSELERVKADNLAFRQAKTELELDNDDLENRQRVEEMSRMDLESKYNRLVERLALLEQELEAKKAVEVLSQRLKDELNDAQNEISVLSKRIDDRAREELTPGMSKVMLDNNGSGGEMKKSSSTSSLPPSKLLQDMLQSVKSLEERLSNCRNIVSPILKNDKN